MLPPVSCQFKDTEQHEIKYLID